LRIEIGGADIESPFHGKRKKEMVSLKSPNLQRCRRVTKSETEIRRRLKKCSRWPGFGVHDAPDLVFTMDRIRRSRWPGKCTNAETLLKIQGAIKTLEKETDESKSIISGAREMSLKIGLRKFAKLIGVDAANLSHALSGKRSLSRAEFVKMEAEILKIRSN
jgi:hypothetical protein